MNSNLDLFLPFLLYAETHYSFKGVYSLLQKKEPEIIADIPYRIEPNKFIPVLLLMKDSHKFPAKINSINIQIIKDNQIVTRKSFSISSDEHIKKKYFWKVFELERPADISGAVKINVEFDITTNNKTKKYLNDNYRISSHAPFDVFLAEDSLPHTENWYYGDIHCHTSYTEDQAEFGAPLEPSILLSTAMGLSFFAATDHSYDLDDNIDDYLQNDTEIPKWHLFQKEVKKLNGQYSDFVILPGEEVSAGNSKNRNVHFLIINNQNFIPGKGDSAEKWFRTKPDLSITEILKRIEDNALAIAAHPEMPPPILQWLLIRRGKWQWADYLHDRLNCMQIWNGVADASLTKGIKRWKNLLLSGRKIFITAGNDAHGNFNRFRQIGFPFWTFREMREQIFGEIKTCVNLKTPPSLETILAAIKQGQCIITNGPFVDFTIQNEKLEIAEIGGGIAGINFLIKATAHSTTEFGNLTELNIYLGDISKKEEILIYKKNGFMNQLHYELEQEITQAFSKTAYIRVELISKINDKKYFCFTNPVWLEGDL